MKKQAEISSIRRARLAAESLIRRNSGNFISNNNIDFRLYEGAMSDFQTLYEEANSIPGLGRFVGNNIHFIRLKMGGKLEHDDAQEHNRYLLRFAQRFLSVTA